MKDSDILYSDGGKPEKVATLEMSCKSRAIRSRLKRGFVVECMTMSGSEKTWRRVKDLAFNELPHFAGLWVQEHGEPFAWFRPIAARCRLRQEGEPE